MKRAKSFSFLIKHTMRLVNWAGFIVASSPFTLIALVILAKDKTLSFLLSVISPYDLPTIFFISSLPTYSALSQLTRSSPITPSAIENSSGQLGNGLWVLIKIAIFSTSFRSRLRAHFHESIPVRGVVFSKDIPT